MFHPSLASLSPRPRHAALAVALGLAFASNAWAEPVQPRSDSESVISPALEAAPADPAHLLVAPGESILSATVGAESSTKAVGAGPGGGGASLPPLPPASPLPPMPPMPPSVQAWIGSPLGSMQSREVSVSIGGLPLNSLAGLGQRVVEGAAFCADAVTESIKPLSDGNRIVQRSTARLCRDTQGRTRQEVGEGASRRVYIHDPVAKQFWSIDAAQKTFQRMQVSSDGTSRTSMSFSSRVRVGADGSVGSPASAALQGEGAEADVGMAERARESAQRMAERAREMANRIRESIGTSSFREERVSSTQVSSAQGPLAGSKSQVMVHVMPVAGSSHGWSNLAPLGISSLRMVSASRGTPVATALPAREMEGIRANGELSTWTIEAGKIGNEKPIRITREVWTSPELMLTVMSKDIDPREGEHHYRLSNINRQAPDPELFKVPADFAEKKR